VIIDKHVMNNFGDVKVGVVLSSGGGRGVFAHTGFMGALSEMGIKVRAMAGCSAGALVGGILASGTTFEDWQNSLARVTTKDYWSPDPWYQFFWNLFIRKGRGYTGLSRNENAINFICHNLTGKTFESCEIPFYSLAYNLSQGRKTVLSKGELAPSIMASAAMPLLYRPVQINNDLFTDGALIELSPTEAICCKHGLDVLLVHHASVHREGSTGLQRALKSNWSLVEILYLLLYNKRPWFLSDDAITFNYCRCGCGARIVSIEPRLPELQWPISKGGESIKAMAREQSLELLSRFGDEIRRKNRMKDSEAVT